MTALNVNEVGSLIGISHYFHIRQPSASLKITLHGAFSAYYKENTLNYLKD